MVNEIIRIYTISVNNIYISFYLFCIRLISFLFYLNMNLYQFYNQIVSLILNIYFEGCLSIQLSIQVV